jgi:hypothetical protein
MDTLDEGKNRSKKYHEKNCQDVFLVNSEEFFVRKSQEYVRFAFIV